MLAATLPLIALVALAIRIGDPGPVFSRHPRLGRFDKPFALYRFRIAAGASASGSRATGIGRFIRASRIEELPQLMNVIRGDLSLVGPTAERPPFAEQLNRAVPFYRQRRYVRPGLTGWAQINARYRSPVRDAREILAHDLYYVKNRSVILDTFILISTLWLVLFAKGSR
jgi:lipopolysaccharide/colanic/teichoic acid biosynthesis glycosyltransferase